MIFWLLFNLFESYILRRKIVSVVHKWTWRNKFTVMRVDWLSTWPTKPYLTIWLSDPISERLIFTIGHPLMLPCYHIQHCVKIVQLRSYFWSVFSCILTECGDLLCKSPVNIHIQSKYRKIGTRNNSIFGQFSRSTSRAREGRNYENCL